ncbi:hypothetical protein [Thaumasiovibrio subtropicus]|uniref:hypothetical protein n=1 Tax=Thaumasiovibrio subtropicus TaxID=1891207 RepID=UPI000B363C50|nr:hypothetical protein [Thaumasiovibrio subtropicus]
MKSWRNLFASGNTSANTAAIAVLADGIYAVKGKHAKDPDFVWGFKAVPTQNQLTEALRSVVTELALSDADVHLVLGQGQYQSLTIDKPDIPAAEWSTALPFLIKDLVNESPANIVAGGVLSSIGHKLQTYITHRDRVKSLLDLCGTAGVNLQSISVEEVTLGFTMPEDRNEMVLYRQGNGGLMLAAYAEQHHCLQRQVRGIQSPVIGDEVNPLVIDSLALELQRSLDYLSSQLRDKPITAVKVCCDGEDNQRLSEELSSRLNVSVNALHDREDIPLPIGVLVAIGALQSVAGKPASDILNLYPDDLKPSKEWVTLNTVVASWLVGTLLVGGGFGYFLWQEQTYRTQLTSKHATLSQLDSQLAELEAQVAARQPSESVKQQVRVLEKSIADMQSAVQAIDGHDDSLTVGYAGIMADLAAIHRRDVSLQTIHIAGPLMDIQGIAAKPQSVPAWVQAFKTQPNLIERGFRHLAIERDASERLVFTLQTNTVNRAE